MKKGPLVRVELQPGRYAKMYKQDAIEQGLIEPDEEEAEQSSAGKKQRPPSQDKMRRPEKDKGQAPEPEDAAPPEPTDDFTEIDGVGPATARALAAHGVETFDELREAGELDYLSASVNAAIEEWRNSG